MATKLKTVEDTLRDMDEAHATLSGAMALAFAEIEAATKAAENPAFKSGGRASKYADLGAVIEAIKPALIKHGLFFTQRCHPDPDGVSVETVLHHSKGGEMSLGTLYVPANKRDAQGFGSALTYARRYALQTAFVVPTEDDDGNAAVATTRTTREEARAETKDAPFPPGPAKNKTALKDMGRALWADVMACEDRSALDALLISQKPLVDQLKVALPAWWSGGVRAVDGGGTEQYEGLGQVIEKLERDFANLENA